MDEVKKALNALQKDLGSAFVSGFQDIKRIRLSSPRLNYLTGGGIAEGRIFEWFGRESSGKTLAALIVAKDYINAKRKVLFIDLERTFDPRFAKKLGINVEDENFIFVRVDSAEQTFETIQKLVETGEIGLCIIDSVAQMTPEAELESNFTDNFMGLQARTMGKGLRKIISLLDQNNSTVIFINQIRDDISIKMGDKTTTPGGKALKFYASARMRFLKAEDILDSKDNLIGIRVKVKSTKNKVGVSGRSVELNIFFDGGIDDITEYAELASDLGVIEKGGAWFTVGTEKFQGIKKVADYLKQNEEEKNRIIKRVDSILFSDSSDLEVLDIKEKDEENSGSTEKSETTE